MQEFTLLALLQSQACALLSMEWNNGTDIKPEELQYLAHGGKLRFKAMKCMYSQYKMA